MAQAKLELSFRSIIWLLICVTFHHAWGEECANLTQADCKIHQQLVTVNNCSRCTCRLGYFHHHGLGGCKSCGRCTFPKAIIQNCTQTSDTECGLCPKDHYRTESGCRKCQGCEHGVLKPCEIASNTICAFKVTSPTMHTEATTIHSNCTKSESQVNNVTLGAKKDWRENQIWCVLFIIESTIVLVALIMRVMCPNYSRKLYALAETSSLATSFSSLLFSKSRLTDITALTDAERETLIQELPGGYAYILAQLLNPNAPNNWVQLACEFKFTLNEIAHLKNASNSESTQDLLLNLGTRNTTVEILWRALKNIRRDDACAALLNFILDLREDDESAIVLIHDY